MRFMHSGMQDEPGLVDRIVSFDDLAFVIRENEI
jgi:hypothetical protein